MLYGLNKDRDKKLMIDDLDLRLDKVARRLHRKYGEVVIDCMAAWMTNRAKPGTDIWKDFPSPNSASFQDRVYHRFTGLPFRAWGMTSREALIEAAREYLAEIEGDK